MYPQIAALIQDLLQGANIGAGRQNAINLRAVHAFLDAIKSGELVVSPAENEKKDTEPVKE